MQINIFMNTNICAQWKIRGVDKTFLQIHTSVT